MNTVHPQQCSTHLIEIGDDPDDVAASEDENNENEKGGDLLVSLLAACCLTVPQTRVLNERQLLKGGIWNVRVEITTRLVQNLKICTKRSIPSDETQLWEVNPFQIYFIIPPFSETCQTVVDWVRNVFIWPLYVFLITCCKVYWLASKCIASWFEKFCNSFTYECEMTLITFYLTLGEKTEQKFKKQRHVLICFNVIWDKKEHLCLIQWMRNSFPIQKHQKRTLMRTFTFIPNWKA